jgi:hypothetical protein
MSMSSLTELNKFDPRLHHVCLNVSKGSLEKVLELFEVFDCKVVYRPKKGGWAMVGQSQLRFALQIAEVSDIPIADVDEKRQTHIAFISKDPQVLIDKVKKWAESNDLEFRQDGWSPIERYFDLPDIFVNFVVEVMHVSIEKE